MEPEKAPERHRRLNWDRIVQLVELLTRAMGPLTRLLDAISRL